MDHSSLAVQEVGYQQCAHGRCLNHGPEWEWFDGKAFEPNPGLFGQKTYWMQRCCGKAMARMIEIQTRRCKKCGREERLCTQQLAVCQCCGYHRNMDPIDDE